MITVRVKHIMLRVAALAAIAFSLLAVPLLAGRIASLFSYPFDPWRAFSWISVHHVAQALLFVPIAWIVSRFVKIDWRLGKGDVRKGLRYVSKFVVVFLIYTAIGFAFALLTDTFAPFAYPLKPRYILGQLGFQLFLSGPSEEWIFRSFGLGLAGLLWPTRWWKGRIGAANVFLAVVFALAHVGVDFAPFALSWNPVQIVYAFVLGFVYGDCLEKTGSVWYAMAIHSLSNVIAVGTTILVTVLL